MSIKKTVAIAAAAGALAAISVPAMALENEFHGFYQIKGIVSNYQDGDFKDTAPTLKDAKANNYAEQRARIFYTAKTSADLKLVTAFELDTRFGGITDSKYTNSSDAGVLDGDGINLETKWVYLDFNATDKVSVKTGLMPYKDSIKGLFIDADLTALYTTTKLDALTLGVGYSRFSEAEQQIKPTSHLGDSAKDLLLVDASYAVNKDLKVGASYYLLEDYQTKDQTLLMSTLGANAEAKVGPATVSGFAAIQFGERDQTKVKNQGYALNVAAKMPVASGTAKAAVLYTSGDKASTATKNEGWVGSGVQSYNESGLMLLVRNNVTSGTTTSNEFFRRTISNVGLISAGYDAKISDKIYANANLGLAWAPEKDAYAAGVKRKSSYIGTELALEGGYKVFDNLTASVQAAYVVLGDYYKADVAGSKLPDNPYTTRLVLTHTF